MVWLLGVQLPDCTISQSILVLNLPTSREIRDSAEEIKAFIATAERADVLETGEREMHSGVMRLTDRSVVGLMTPRTEVDWIDITGSHEEIKERIISTPHSRLPVGEGSV